MFWSTYAMSVHIRQLFNRAARCGTFVPNWHISRSMAHLAFVAHCSIKLTVFVLTQSSINESISLCVRYCRIIATPIPYNCSEKLDLQKGSNTNIKACTVKKPNSVVELFALCLRDSSIGKSPRVINITLQKKGVSSVYLMMISLEYAKQVLTYLVYGNFFKKNELNMHAFAGTFPI